MSDRADRAVQAVLALGVAACAVTALFMRPAGLPAASRDAWLRIAQARAAPPAATRLTFAIDTVAIAGAREQPWTSAAIDVPAGSALRIRGWAVDPAGLVAARGLRYRVDAGPWRAAAYGLPRPDVAAYLGRPDASASGFLATLGAGTLAPGTHAIAFAVTGTRGSASVLPARVRVRVSGR